MKQNNYLMLVNKNNLYKGSNFELVRFENLMGKFYLEIETYNAFMKLSEEVKLSGYEVLIESGYRSIERQQQVLDEIIIQEGREYASKYVALPGASEHHTGLALDFVINDNGKIIDGFFIEGHPVTKLVYEIAPNYGFILRYPKGKEDITGYGAEPWHLRYVTPIIAKEITELGITLEEYLLLRRDLGEEECQKLPKLKQSEIH